jgi:hypothetical protein
MNRCVEAFKESEYTRARTFAESISKRSEYTGLDVPTSIRDKDSQLTNALAAVKKNLQNAYERQTKNKLPSSSPKRRKPNRNWPRM